MICQNCGKKLRDVNSIARGYGPVCWERITGEKVPSTRKSRRSAGTKVEPEDDNIPGQMEFKDYPGFIPDGMKI